MVEGLGESTRLVWSGDVDLNCGDVSKLYKKYKDLLNFIDSLSMNCEILGDLSKCSAMLIEEKEFLVKGTYACTIVQILITNTVIIYVYWA